VRNETWCFPDIGEPTETEKKRLLPEEEGKKNWIAVIRGRKTHPSRFDEARVFTESGRAKGGRGDRSEKGRYESTVTVP